MRKIKSMLVVLLLIVSGIGIIKTKALDQPFPVYGYIKDSDGNPLPSGVKVIIRDLTKSTQMAVYTSKNGYYQADLYNLPDCEDGDLIEVYCSYGNEVNSKSFVLDVTQPSKNVSFSLIGPPSIQTINATSITSNSAILMANLTDLGGDTSCQVWFEYGETTSYGKTSSKKTVYSTGTISISITNLKPDTTYHFRAVAKNSKKTAYGEDKIFTTPPTLPSVKTMTASNIGYSFATLNGYLSNVGAKSCEVWFVYDTTYHSDWRDYKYSTSKIVKTSVGSFSYTITGLELNVTYHFRAVANNSAGAVAGNDATFTTQIILPSIQTINATSITSNTAILMANLTDLGGDTSCQVWFEYGETTSYGFVSERINLTGKQTIAIEITGLKAGVTYHFRAVAENSRGIAYGEDKIFTTEVEKAKIETKPAEIAIILKANVTDLGGGNCTVWFEYWEEEGEILKTENRSINKEGLVEEVITGLKENTTYYYRAVIKNEKGVSYGMNLSFKLFSLPAPPSVETGNAIVGYENATLYGNITSLGDNERCFVWFEYWNGEKKTTEVKSVNATGEINVEIDSLEDGTKYYYRIIAVGENGRICYGEIRNFTTLARENHPPKVSLISPGENSTVGSNVSLIAYVEDVDNDTITVTFYLNNEKLHTVESKTGYVSVAVNLQYGMEYEWYVVVNDGKQENMSEKIKFRTIEAMKADFYYEGMFAGEEIEFIDNSTGDIVSWLWNFGDGSIGYGKNVSHSYSKAGSYMVNLTIIDEYGNRCHIEKEINVWERGDANMDGKINALDITKIKKIISGEEATPPADANNDGKIDEEDVMAVVNKILG